MKTYPLSSFLIVLIGKVLYCELAIRSWLIKPYSHINKLKVAGMRGGPGWHKIYLLLMRFVKAFGLSTIWGGEIRG